MVVSFTRPFGPSIFTGTLASDVSRDDEAILPVSFAGGGAKVYGRLMRDGMGFPSRLAGVSVSFLAASMAEASNAWPSGVLAGVSTTALVTAPVASMSIKTTTVTVSRTCASRAAFG